MLFWKLRYKFLMARARSLKNAAEEVAERFYNEPDHWWKEIRRREQAVYINRSLKMKAKARRLEIQNAGWIRRKKKWW